MKAPMALPGKAEVMAVGQSYGASSKLFLHCHARQVPGVSSSMNP